MISAFFPSLTQTTNNNRNCLTATIATSLPPPNCGTLLNSPQPHTLQTYPSLSFACCANETPFALSLHMAHRVGFGASCGVCSRWYDLERSAPPLPHPLPLRLTHAHTSSSRRPSLLRLCTISQHTHHLLLAACATRRPHTNSPSCFRHRIIVTIPCILLAGG